MDKRHKIVAGTSRGDLLCQRRPLASASLQSSTFQTTSMSKRFREGLKDQVRQKFALKFGFQRFNAAPMGTRAAPARWSGARISDRHQA